MWNVVGSGVHLSWQQISICHLPLTSDYSLFFFYAPLAMSYVLFIHFTFKRNLVYLISFKKYRRLRHSPFVTANKYLPFTAYFSLFTAFSTPHLPLATCYVLFIHFTFKRDLVYLMMYVKITINITKLSFPTWLGISLTKKAIPAIW